MGPLLGSVACFPEKFYEEERMLHERFTNFNIGQETEPKPSRISLNAKVIYVKKITPYGILTFRFLFNEF